MNQTPLQIIDGLLDPIIQAANKVRQVRDALPPAAWLIVPVAIRTPLDTLFLSVENYDRMLGRLKMQGLVGNDVGTTAPE